MVTRTIVVAQVYGVVLLLLASAGGCASAQTPESPTSVPTPRPDTRKSNKVAPGPSASKIVSDTHAQLPQGSPVNGEQALYLVRATLLTLNDANRSGNYSVLRDLAAPSFQARNSAADLAAIFVNLRHRKIDLHAVAIMAPQFTALPTLDENKMLRLSGYFPTTPLQVRFELMFENVAGRWRLFGISVQTPEAPPQPQTRSAPAGSGAAASPAGPRPASSRAR